MYVGKNETSNNIIVSLQLNLPKATAHDVKDMWTLTGGGRLPEVRPQGVWIFGNLHMVIAET